MRSTSADAGGGWGVAGWQTKTRAVMLIRGIQERCARSNDTNMVDVSAGVEFEKVMWNEIVALSG